MEGLLYCTMNLFCVLLLTMIFNSIRKSSDQRMSQHMFAWFIIASILLCLSDFIWGLIDFSTFWTFSQGVSFAVNAVYYIFTCVASYMWFLFSENEQDSKVVKSKTGLVLSLLPLLVYIVLVVGSYKHGWLFYIDGDGKYQRGDFYIIKIIIACFYIGTTSFKATAKAFMKKNYLNKEKYLALASFVAFPSVAVILQVLFVGSPMISAGVAFAAVQVYIFSREQLISVDPLTNLNNRNVFMHYLDSKMKSNNDSKDLYLFVMDLDYFKKINDTFGHIEGDEAIVMVADVLRSVVRKTNYFVCRYGGDEFIAVCETDKDFNPEEFGNEINRLLIEETLRKDKVYNLHLSIGYAKYNDIIETIPEFIDIADERLYEIKNKRVKQKERVTE